MTKSGEEEESNNISTSIGTIIAGKLSYFVSSMNMQHYRAFDFVNDVELLNSENS